MSTQGSSVRVVMHQVQSPENLGAAARIMANFGFGDLILSSPVLTDFEAARPMARGSAVLASMRTVPHLSDALEDCVYVCGTTSRTELYGRTFTSPEKAVDRLLAQRSRGKVALLFGGERRGLSDDELALCQEIAVIPTEPAQPSMNLAQAMAVMLYQCMRRGHSESLPADELVPGAPLGLLQRLETQMKAVLGRVDFLNAQAPELILRELMRSLVRDDLTRREAELWLTAFKQLERVISKT